VTVVAAAAVASLAEQQRDLLARMAALDPAPCIMGGYAEDALLAGTVTRPHADIDWIVLRSELELELGIVDETDGRICVRVHRLNFDIGGKEAPAGYQLILPRDTFRHPPVEIDGMTIRPASPLALYQLRVGIARQGSFGDLSERHLRTSRRLRETFFPGRSDDDLEPRIEPLS
jgi:hypothetical protein